MLSSTKGHSYQGKIIEIFTLLCCLLKYELGCAAVLNPPKILLPYNYGIPSNYTVSVGDVEGKVCSFEWTSSDPAFVVVDPICDFPGSGCCREAVVSVVFSAAQRKVTRVTATHDGETELKCDVITDTPHSIELSYLANELFIHGIPEVVTIVAKDRYGHTFSSINGLHFEWKILNDSDGKVRLRPLSDSKDYPSGMQLRGILGHRILVEPLQMGPVNLYASLSQRDLLALTTIRNQFMIYPNVFLRGVYPSGYVFLLPFAAMNIVLEEMDGGKRFENTDFSMEANPPGVVDIAKDLSSVEGVKEGETKLTITYHNSNFSKLNLDVFVDTPTHLRFRISSGDFTTLEETKIYIISVDVCNKQGKVFFPSDNLRIKVSFPTTLFYVNSTTTNGTWHVVQALVPGKGVLKAELQGTVFPDGSLLKGSQLSGSVEVTIVQRLHVFPPYVLLPSDSTTSPLHEIRLMASGGTGHYVWTSNNLSAGTFLFDKDQSHVGHLQIHKESDFSVTVTDERNINFIASAKISVQPVLDVEVYPTVVEAEVGNILILPVALLAYEDKERKIIRKFDDCSKIKLTVEIIEKHVLVYDQEPHIPAFGKGCHSLQFKCKLPGYSRVNIFYEAPSKTGDQISTQKTTTVLACFKPLEPVHPVRVAVIPLGAAKEIAFEGGPRKWPLFKSGHSPTLSASAPELVDIEIIKDPIRFNKDLTVFKVICKGLGENTLTFRIGNSASPTNPHPAKEETSIKVFCSEPFSLHLKLVKKGKLQLPGNVVKVPFYGEKLFEVDVWLKDDKGRKFANISSLNMEWEVSDKLRAEPESYTGFTSYDNAVAGYRKVTRDFKTFKMTGETGQLEIIAKVNGYRKNVFTDLEIPFPGGLKEISGSIDLELKSLRDLDLGTGSLYPSESNTVQGEQGICDGDSC